MAARFPVSPEPLPLGEVSPQVTERARTLAKDKPFSSGFDWRCPVSHCRVVMTERVPSREKVDRENPQIFPIYKL